MPRELRVLKGLLEKPEYQHLRRTLRSSPWWTLTSPLCLPQMERAADLLADAVQNGVHVVIAGDRDVDGVSSTALIGGVLKEAGHKGQITFRVSTEGDDYGLTGQFLTDVRCSGAGLAILLDMGSSHGPEIHTLCDQGINVIILDHHQIHDRAPDHERAAFVNPMRLAEQDRGEHSGKIATAGLAFKLALAFGLRLTPEWKTIRCVHAFRSTDNVDQPVHAFRCGLHLGLFKSFESVLQEFPNAQSVDQGPGLLGALSEPERIAEEGRRLLGEAILSRPRFSKFVFRAADLAAVGLVADMVPLVSENRAVVRIGSRLAASLKQSEPGEALFRPGMAALMAALKIPVGPLRSRDLSWSIGPAINAAGRMGRTDLALQLLLEVDPGRAKVLAGELVQLNQARKDRTIHNQTIIEKYFEADPLRSGRPLIFCFDPELKPGVSGIMATRLLERHEKPVVYIQPEGGFAKGSVRVPSGWNALDLLSPVTDLLVQWGGHPEAAGFSLDFANIGRLEESLHRVAEEMALVVCEPQAKVTSLITITPRDLNADLIRELDLLEPFGAGNPEPLFTMKGVEIAAQRPLSQGLHVLFGIKGASKQTEGVIWRRGVAFSAAVLEAQERGQGMTLTGGVELSYFAGRSRVRFRTETFIAEEASGSKAPVLFGIPATAGSR